MSTTNAKARRVPGPDDFAHCTDAHLVEVFDAWQEALRGVRAKDDRLAITYILIAISAEQAKRAA